MPYTGICRDQVFHSGTGRNEAGALVSTGGRVLTITSKGKTIEAAQSAAYQVILF